MKWKKSINQRIIIGVKLGISFLIIFLEEKKMILGENSFMNCKNQFSSETSILCSSDFIFYELPDTTQYLKIVCDCNRLTFEVNELLANNFYHIKNLTKLEIYNCRFIHLRDGLLLNLTTLKDFVLNFSDCEKSVFDEMRLRPTLQNDNPHQSEKFTRISTDLIHLPCSSSNLRNLSLIGNRLSRIQDIGCEITDGIQILNLNSNNLTAESLQQMRPLKSLEFLEMRNNEIGSIISNFFKFPSLRSLDLSSNKIAKIYSHAFEECKNLTSLNLAENLIDTLIDENLKNIFDSPDLPNLQLLNLTYNDLHHVDFSWIPCSVLILDLSSNPLRRLSDRKNFSAKLNLNSLLLRDIKILNLYNYDFPSSVAVLDFTGSNLDVCSTKHFSKLSKLESLYIDALYVKSVERFAFSSSLNRRSLLKIFLNTGNINCSCIRQQLNPKKYKEGYDLCMSRNETIRDINTLEQYVNGVPSYCQVVTTCNARVCVYLMSPYHCQPQTKEERTVITDCGRLILNDIPSNLSPNSTTVYLDGNNFPHVDLIKLFVNDSKIEFLYLNYSNIHTLEFAGSSDRLKYLNLQNNFLQHLQPDIWERFKNLKHLNLQNNSLVDFNTETQPFKKWVSLHLEFNSIEEFPYDTIEHNSMLETLFLQFNRITEIKNTICKSNLVNLHLENNFINRINFNGESNIRLNRLFLQNNKLSVLQNNSFGCFKFLEELHLEGNNLAKIMDGNFRGLSNLYKLFIQSNGIDSIEKESFANLKKLKELDLSNNSLENVDDFDLRRLEQLKILKLTGNKLDSFTNTIFHERVKLNTLNLGQNRFQEISLNWLKDRSSIESLFLNDNQISEINSDSFTYISELKELHLENNKIIRLSGSEFRKMKNLKKLYLNGNRMSYVNEFSFKDLISLEYLFLQNNTLKNPEIWKFNFSNSLRQINFENNSIICECDYVRELQSWISKDNIVVNPKKYLCSHNKINFETFLKDNCADDTYLIAMCISISFAIFLGLLIFLLYKYRLEIEVLMYSHFKVRFFYDKTIDEGKKYHAFIGYSAKDMDFIGNVLVPGLSNYRLCLHDRDFTIGIFITENIINAVYNSCCTVLVLSKNSVKSEWCRYEFKMAHHKSLADRCRRLIVIVLEDIEEKDMEEEMVLYMKTHTYLHWQDKLFWEKLYFALPNLEEINLPNDN